jgi:hypothetical protein
MTIMISQCQIETAPTPFLPQTRADITMPQDKRDYYASIARGEEQNWSMAGFAPLSGADQA